MDFLLKLIPPWVPAAIILATSCLAGWYAHQNKELRRDLLLAKAAYTQRLLVAETAAREALEQARHTEQTWADRLATIQEQAHARELQNQAAARAAAASDQRLRDALRIAAHALRSGQTSSDPAAPSLGETGARAAELLGACSERYRVVAAAATRAVTAGEQCQQSYDALKERRDEPTHQP